MRVERVAAARGSGRAHEERGVKRPLLVLALIAVLLVGADRLLSARSPSAGHAPELVHLAGELRGGNKVIAGLSLDLDEGRERYLYARSRGVWRCLSAWGAPCDGEHVEQLVVGLLAARGVVLDGSGATADSFGLAGPGALEIALHGKALVEDPGGDELLRVRFAGAESPFVRVAPRPSVVELDFRLGAALKRDGEGLPPLLDTRIAPIVFPEPGQRVAQLLVQRSDGPPFELTRRAKEPSAAPDPEDPAAALDWEWWLSDGAREVALAPLRGEAYVTWIPRAPYVALADPASAPERGLAPARAKLTLVPDGGEPLEIEVGSRGPDGGLWVRTPQVLSFIDAASARMLLPELDELTDDSRENLWDIALRKALAEGRLPR
jgi:hypothetical protein